mgnify:CR=1 FL=1
MELDFSPVWSGWSQLLHGALVTVEITAVSLLLGCVLGLLIGIGRLNPKRRVIYAFCTAYVAAIRGTALGGGLEISLASTYILASDREDVRIGLPEIKLGIVPGWGGCVRLPRRIGIAAALDIILAGKAVPSRTAFRLGLVDALLPDASFEHLAIQFAGAKATRRRNPAKERRGPPSARSLLLERNPIGRSVLFSQASKRAVAATRASVAARPPSGPNPPPVSQVGPPEA